MNKYCIGGLEPNEDDRSEVIEIAEVKYLLTDKFKTMLRDSFIDWGTFLEVYHDNLDYTTMFDQVVKLLDIKENENLRSIMLPIVKKIYHLPADAHLACMMKQFMVYEPVSIAIHQLFTVLKNHFENLVERFVIARNRHLIDTKLDRTVKINNWDELLKDWDDVNNHYNLETSSLILLFLNPPKNIKSGLHLKIPNNTAVDKLKASVSQFHYMGFCPKVPYERLVALFKFPISDFVNAIKSIDKTAKFPNYNKIENHIAELLSDKKELPTIVDDIKRETPPVELIKALKVQEATSTGDVMSDTVEQAKLQLTQWYVTKILELRKQLVKYGKQYEEYYISMAKTINTVTEYIQGEINTLE
jgi:hypothetical protein